MLANGKEPGRVGIRWSIAAAILMLVSGCIVVAREQPDQGGGQTTGESDGRHHRGGEGYGGYQGAAPQPGDPVQQQQACVNDMAVKLNIPATDVAVINSAPERDGGLWVRMAAMGREAVCSVDFYYNVRDFRFER
jgi:hypothetical protein